MSSHEWEAAPPLLIRELGRRRLADVAMHADLNDERITSIQLTRQLKMRMMHIRRIIKLQLNE